MKRLFTLTLAVMMVFALCANAGANNTTINSPGGTANTELVYTVAQSFAVTIPDDVPISPGTPTHGDIQVIITNIPHETEINAAITKINEDESATDFVVKHAGDNTKTVGYTVKSSEDGTTYTDYTKGTKVGNRTQTGTIYFQYTLGSIPANHPSGDYSGTVTFTITLDSITTPEDP